MSFSVVLYTHRDLREQPYRECFLRLRKALSYTTTHDYMPPSLVAVTSVEQRLPRPWHNIVATGQHGLHDCYTKIVAGLEAAKHPQVFLVEHDVLYPGGYFDHILDADNAFTYNQHVWRLTPKGAWSDPCWLTSNCCAHRDLLLRQFRGRIATIEAGGRIVWDEPGRNEGDIAGMIPWTHGSLQPVIDVRHGGNLTGERDNPNARRHIPYWGDAEPLLRAMGITPHLPALPPPARPEATIRPISQVPGRRIDVIGPGQASRFI